MENQDFQAQSIVERMTDGFVQFDREWTYVYVNKHAAQLFGTTPDALVGKKYLDMFPEAEGTAFQKAYLNAMTNRVHIHLEEYFPPWNRWFENHIYPLADGIAIFFHEITERKLYQEKLTAAAAQLADAQVLTSLIIDSLPINIYLKDATGRYLLFNEESARVTGMPKDQAIGKTDVDLFPEHIARSIQEEDKYVIRTGESTSREIAIPVHHQERYMLAGRKRLEFADSEPMLLGFAIDITERRESELRAQYLGNYDVLTGLPNRRLLQDRLEHAVSHARRSLETIAVLFVDVDRFKVINDSLGHEVGDKFLRILSERLRHSVRESDTAARLSGDEFVILLTDLGDRGSVAFIGEKILVHLSQPLTLGTQTVIPSASMGIALYPNDAQDAATLLKNADIAMYYAKKSGGNGLRFFDAEMNAQAVRRMQIESGLRQALNKDRDELTVWYQPFVDLESGHLLGLEALARWNSPALGAIAPDVFIPIAEETGLIVDLGEHLLRLACAQFQNWRDAKTREAVLSVNLSVMQLNSNDLLPMVQSVLTDTGLSPHRLQFEITETALMRDVNRARSTLQKLAGMGIQLAIDDFGIGYSSLSYLKTLPIHKLKIDRSFVRDIIADRDDASIVIATIGLAHALGLRVTSEGVETADQVSFLREHACDEAQGYYFSRPLDAEGVETYFAMF